jgi:hypothetical protein
MFESFTFWLGVLAALIAYLGVSARLRWRAEEARRRARENESPGPAFDASAMTPRIQQVRRNHVAALQARFRPPSCRRQLIAAARRTLTHFSYFCRARAERGFHQHDP